MIIPLNLPQDPSKALSIVATTEGYSVALMSIVNGYGMENINSYECLNRPSPEESYYYQYDPCPVFERQLAKGPDLLQCLNKAMSILAE